MATNRDVIRMVGLENLLFHLDSMMCANFDHIQAFGANGLEYGCILEMIEGQDIDKYCGNYDDGCRGCISRWLDEEYDGTWEIDPD